MTSRIQNSKLLITVIGFLVLFAIMMSVLHYFRDPYNTGFVAYPIATFIHIVPGIIYLLLAPFQFMSSIRNKQINIHIWIGRIITLFALLVGITAFFMAIVFPFSGLIESISVGFFAIIFLIALVKGLVNIRAKNIALHREWMIRAFALGLAIATSRIVFLPLFFSFADPTIDQIKNLFIGCFILAFSTHLIFAEWWIRRTKNDEHITHAKKINM